MTTLALQAGPYRLLAVLDEAACPRTCAAVLDGLPFDGPLIHAHWSGEALRAPLGELDLGLPWEAATAYPAPGQLLLHPGGPGAPAEAEILLPYGPARIHSRAGPLVGNPFATLLSGLDALAELGRMALWEGAQRLTMEVARMEPPGDAPS
ncbi:MAG: DUF3830 family protein [Pseudomonadota bacterium]